MPPDRSFSLAQIGAYARAWGLPGLWRWWSGELASLVPSGARNAVKRRRLRPVIAFDGNLATLWRPVMRDGALAMEAAATVALDGDAQAVAAAGARALEAVVRATPGRAPGAPRVRIAIPPRVVLRRALTLPSAVEESLRQAVGYDLDRLTPFKADELYFDAVVVSRDTAQGTIGVDFAAVRRPVVDAAIAHATAWGAEVRGVTPDDPAAAHASRLNLAPDAFRTVPAPWKRWQFWVPIGALAAIALVAVVLPLWQKREYAIALINRAEQVRQQAAVSERLRADLERAAGDYNFALERKHQWPPMVRVLDTVTRVLPDDTWLTQLEVRTLPKGKDRDREIVMRGESGNAGRLIPVLEESGLVAQVAPRSPTTKIQPGPGEVFDLGAQLKPLPKPAMVPLAETPAVPPPAATTATAPTAAPATPATAPAPTAAPAPATTPPAPAPTTPAPAPAAPATPAKGARP